MSRSLAITDNKRKRPDSAGLTDAERAVLDSIKSRKDLGVWDREIKNETGIPDKEVDKSIKSLVSKNLIKKVVNVQNKLRKHFMAVEYEPSKEVTGGDWYVDGNLDKELIETIKRVSSFHIRTQKVATLDAVTHHLNGKNFVMFKLSNQQVEEILNSMILDNDIIEVKSNGLGDCRLIPIGTVCYRMANAAGVGKGPRMGAFASIPCGACPRIGLCTPDGVISPSTCVYYTKWLKIDF